MIAISKMYKTFFSLCPLLIQNCIAILRATSTDTEPESTKKTFSKSFFINDVIFLDKLTACLCINPPNITWGIVLSCFETAFKRKGLLYPKQDVHHEDIESIKTFPFSKIILHSLVFVAIDRFSYILHLSVRKPQII